MQWVHFLLSLATGLFLIAPIVLTGLTLFGDFFQTPDGTKFNLYDATCMTVNNNNVLERHNSCGRSLDIIQIFVPVSWIINIMVFVPLWSFWLMKKENDVQDAHPVFKHSPTVLLLISFAGMLTSFLVFNSKKDEIKFITGAGEVASKFEQGEMVWAMWLATVISLIVTCGLWITYAVKNGFKDWAAERFVRALQGARDGPASGRGISAKL
jgi:NADH:ubiquinone oxidoreductase subunit 5 (subunit L)/multisubunit Na+/H+ antiporter MnhA subunit